MLKLIPAQTVAPCPINTDDGHHWWFEGACIECGVAEPRPARLAIRATGSGFMAHDDHDGGAERKSTEGWGDDCAPTCTPEIACYQCR